MADYVSAIAGAVDVAGGQAPYVRLSGPALEAAVVPQQGGEIASLRAFHQGAWFETLHRALDYRVEKNEWRGRAPLQWPAVGRNCVPEELHGGIAPQDLMVGSWRCEGKRYPMPILGFAQYMSFSLIETGNSAESAWALCRAGSSDYSRQYYPFEFELLARHALEAEALRSRWIVRNLEPERVLPFSIGNHITFRLPFTAEGTFEDCLLTSPTTHHMELNRQDLLSGRMLPKDLRRGAALADGELWNMVLGPYRRDAAAVELRDPRSFGFRISQREVVAGAPRAAEQDIHFVLYAERSFRSFCPEPWIGEPNSLNSGKGLIRLGPGEEFTWEMRVQLLAGRRSERPRSGRPALSSTLVP